MSADRVRLNRAQRLALALDRNISLIAGAGTGKTEVLSRRFLAILDKNRTQDWTAPEVACPPGGLVAMTYTRKAAGEMRERIARDIGRHVRAAHEAGDIEGYAYWVRMRRLLKDARITTIHGLCIEIVLDHALLLGIDPASTVLEEVDQSVLIDESISEALGDVPDAQRDALARLLVSSPLGQVRKALTALVGDRGFADEWSTAMRQSDLDQLLARLRRRVAPCTPDEAAVRLRQACDILRPIVALPTRPRGEKAERFLAYCQDLLGRDVTDEDQALEAYCTLLARFQNSSGKVYAAGSAHALLGSQAEWEPTGDKRRGIELFQTLRAVIIDDAQDFIGLPDALDREMLHLMRALAVLRDDIERRYTEKKRRRRALDYADLEHLALRLLETRPGVLDDVRRRIRHLMVDEFQDTNSTQWRLIRLLASDDPIDPALVPEWAVVEEAAPEAPVDDEGAFVSAASLFGLDDSDAAHADRAGGPEHPAPPVSAAHPPHDIATLHPSAEATAQIVDVSDAGTGGDTDAPGPALGDDRLFIVGDAKQSIYAFRGADVTVYQASRAALKRANEASDTTRRPLLRDADDVTPLHPDEARGEIRLDENFRSLPNIVRFTNQLFDRVFAPAEGPRHAAYEAAPGALVPKRPELEVADDSAGGTVTVLAVPDDPERYLASGRPDRARLARLGKKETAYLRLAQHIDESVNGARPRMVQDERRGTTRPAEPRDIAILLPSRTHLKELERALESFGVPYVVTGGRGYWGRPEVWDHVNLVAFLADTHRDVALAALLRSPFFAWTDDAVLALTLDDTKGPLWKKLARAAAGESDWQPPNGFAGMLPAHVHKILDDAQRAAGISPTHRLIGRIHEATGYVAALSRDPRPEQSEANVKKFLRLVRDRETRQGVHMGRLARDLLRRVDDQVDEPEAPIPDDAPGVRILTVHAAKGLEHPIVYLPDLDRRFPADSLGEARGYNKGSLDGAPLVTISVRDQEGETQPPVLHRWLAEEAKARTRAEQARLLYVAATRARDHLVLVASTPHLFPPRPEKATPPAHRDAACWRDWIEDALGLDGPTYLDAYDRDKHQATQHLGDVAYMLDCRPPMAPEGPAASTAPASAAPVAPAAAAGPGIPPHADPPITPDPTAPSVHLARPDLRDPAIPPFVLHPSAIETYRECPARFRHRHIEGLPDLQMRGTALTAPDRGRLLGSAVHRVLESTTADEPIPEPLAARLRGLAREHGFSPDGFLDDVRRHTDRARRTLPNDNAVLKELVLDHQWAAGIRTRGVIDRLDHTSDGWIIHDTKSDRPEGDLAAHARSSGYDGQLALYRDVIEATAGAVQAARLVFTATGQVLDVPQDETLDALRERLGATRNIRPGDEDEWERLWPRRPHDPEACRSCGLHQRFGGPCVGT